MKMKSVSIFLCSLLLCVVSAPGEGDGTMPSEEVIRTLEEGGYGLCIQFASVPSISEEEMSASLKALRTKAERRIERVVNSDLLAKLQKPYLTPIRGKGTAPDRFVAECQVDDARVMIAVGELKITFNVVPGNPKALSKDEAINCFVDWSKRLFKASGNQTGYVIEVSEKPEFWIVYRIPTDEKGNRRSAWTWPESITMALDNKHGKWLSIAVRDSLQERVAGSHGPKSTGEGITYGHWFDTANGQSRDALKKNAEKRGQVSPNNKSDQ